MTADQTQYEIDNIEACLNRYDEADEMEVDSEEYQRLLLRLVELRGAQDKTR